ncbi:hemerythrin family protein [Burkholderia sp. Ac-20353]|uniref:bacteriohemerythrin n=1 Tax=Burkholderia sp. Ac-20353 TaxID=2703894 RepID=UPI001F1194D3|nr:hemerythrin family protein [Burkholderia sp. Ac-20353]
MEISQDISARNLPSAAQALTADVSAVSRKARQVVGPEPVSPAFEWKDALMLGHTSMDEMDHEFVGCVNALLTVDDDGLAAALESFDEHARRRFGEEDDDMRRTAYESAGCHIDEHAAVLRSVVEVCEALAEGRTQVVGSLGRALMDWIPEHVA